jgi:hypothetical protein
MTSRLLAVLGVLALGFGLAARAEPGLPVKVAPKTRTEGKGVNEANPKVQIQDAAAEQERLKRQFDDFKQALLGLAQRLENSAKQEDRDKGKVLREAIKKASDEGVDTRFTVLVESLRKSDVFENTEQMQQILDQNKDLRRVLRDLIDLLLKDDRDAQLKAERLKTQKLLEELKALIQKQELHQTKVVLGRGKTPDLADLQKKLADQTRNLGSGKKNDGAENKHGEGKDGGKTGREGVGEAKQDAKDPKADSKNKGEGKEGTPGKEGKEGEGKDGKGGEGKEGKPGEGKDGKGAEGKEGKPGDGKEGKEGKPGEGKDGKGGEGKEGKPGEGKEGKPGDGKEGKPGEGKEGKPGDGKSGEPKDGKGGEGKEGKPGEGKPGAGKPSDGKPSDGKPSAGKPGEGKNAGKPGEGKPSDSKGKGEGKGEAKGGKGSSGKPSEGKPSESKGGQSGQPGQPGESKGGGKSGQQPPQPPQDPGPIKKQIEDANKYQNQAEKDLRKDDRKDAGDNEEKAVDQLKIAQKKLEDLLRQIREEEIERLLARLEARCRHMLAMQIAVRDGTVELDKTIKANPKGEKTRADEIAGNGLADKEEEIIKEATAGLRLLEAEGSAVAFAEVFQQVRADMITVHGRLNKTDVGVVTVTIENQIIDTLSEMVEALKKAQQQAKSKPKPGQPGQQGPPQDQKLIDLLAELKMIRSMQKRVNDRTEVYGKQYSGEQAPPVDAAADAKQREQFETIQKELKDLAERQKKIGRITRDIAEGKNEAK